MRRMFSKKQIERIAEELGPVSSVNNKSGAVVLDATDIKLTTNKQTVQDNFIRIDTRIDSKGDKVYRHRITLELPSETDAYVSFDQYSTSSTPVTQIPQSIQAVCTSYGGFVSQIGVLCVKIENNVVTTICYSRSTKEIVERTDPIDDISITDTVTEI